MFRSSVLTAITVIATTSAVAQTYTYAPVYTPKCSSVNAHEGTEVPQHVIDS